MKHTLIFILGIVLTSCAAMQTGEGLSADGRMTTVQPSENYPKVVVTPSGQHAQMMRPTGNLATVINPDGTHSTAVVNGSMATVITP